MYTIQMINVSKISNIRLNLAPWTLYRTINSLIGNNYSFTFLIISVIFKLVIWELLHIIKPRNKIFTGARFYEIKNALIYSKKDNK